MDERLFYGPFWPEAGGYVAKQRKIKYDKDKKARQDEAALKRATKTMRRRDAKRSI